ncbi:MAG TPA: ribonuclease P protein component [Tissierellia bacterium]|nr:ribonuclease P protein component [Tissierellia bacterium]
MTSLKRNYEFQRAYSRGRSALTKYFVLYVVKTRKSQNHVGFTVSKKVGNAVVRNRIRRRLKEAFRSIPITACCYDIVIVARSRAKTVNYTTLRTTMEKELGRLIR